MGKAQDHFSPVELKNMAGDYFDVTSTKGDELIGRCPCPGHLDKNPSFSYNPVKDKCYCFSCKFSGDIIDLWGVKHGSGDKKENLKAFFRAFNLSDGLNRSNPVPEKKKSVPYLDEAYEQLGRLPESMIDDLKRNRGWSRETIEKLGLRLQTHYLKNGRLVQIKKPDRIAIPICDSNGHIVNIRCYKPGAKQNKIFSFGKMYGSTRLFPRYEPGEGLQQ